MIKFVLGLIIGVALVIFAVQNTEVVQITFFAWTVSVSRAVMVVVIFLLGMITGWVLTSLGRRRKIKKAEAEKQ